MKKVCIFLLIAVGLLNLFPIVGVISTEQLNSLYGISISSPDLGTLMRHRAVMLGLIGILLLLSAFRSSLQVIAASIGLLSMSSFVLLAYLSGDIGPELNNVVIADIVGSIAIALVLSINLQERRRAT